MNKKTFGLILIIFTSIAAGVTYLATGSSGETSEQSAANTQMVKTENPAPAVTDSQSNAAKAGAYVDYSQEALASTTDTKVLFFHAPWCPQCRALEANIKQQGVPDGVTILKVDYDSNQALRKKYGVTIQTSLVRVDDKGDLIKKYVAYDQPTLAAIKANLLQ